MENPKISVIVPVYNVEKYLHRCVDSILAQTFKDFELILIDAPNDIFELNEVVAGLRRGDTSNPHVHLYQGSHFRFVFDQDVAWTLDGEDGGKVTRADINVEAGAIAVMFKNK